MLMYFFFLKSAHIPRNFCTIRKDSIFLKKYDFNLLLAHYFSSQLMLIKKKSLQHSRKFQHTFIQKLASKPEITRDDQKIFVLNQTTAHRFDESKIVTFLVQTSI
jgi:hypothetical protein